MMFDVSRFSANLAHQEDVILSINTVEAGYVWDQLITEN